MNQGRSPSGSPALPTARHTALSQRRLDVSSLRTAVVAGVAMVMSGCSTALIDKNATPGEVFRKFVREREAYCRKAPPDPRDTSCRFLEVKPWTPGNDEASRFAHSLTIPNPVPQDSGYRPGMTPDQYFHLLCEKEAGEFIYKVIRNVDGVFELRPREPFRTHTEQHLYEPEDPFGYYANGRPALSEFAFVGIPFSRYAFFERSAGSFLLPRARLDNFDPSYGSSVPAMAGVERFTGYSGELRSMIRTFDTSRRAEYGFTWRGIVRPKDREMGIAGGELIVLDLRTNEVLGVRRNYKQTVGLNWLGARSCPQLAVKTSNGTLRAATNFEFVSKILVPDSAK